MKIMMYLLYINWKHFTESVVKLSPRCMHKKIFLYIMVTLTKNRKKAVKLNLR